MSVQSAVHHIAACTVCATKFDETGEYLYWSDTPEQAIAWVEDDDHWVVLAGDTVICPVSDAAHDSVRGHLSPIVLEPGPDAMVAQFTLAPQS